MDCELDKARLQRAKVCLNLMAPCDIFNVPHLADPAQPKAPSERIKRDPRQIDQKVVFLLDSGPGSQLRG